MASASAKNKLQDIFECVVCTETYKDPRSLHCGHTYCKVCLENILGQQVTSSLPCPVCRHVSEIPPGEKVADLPRLRLVNKLQEKISGILTSSGEIRQTRSCDVCSDGKVTAEFYCGECDDNLCDTCARRHQKLEGIDGHEAFPITKYCPEHPKKKLVMYCHDCHVFLCPRCIMGDHHSHITVKIEDVAFESRRRLEEIAHQTNELERDVQYAQKTRAALNESTFAKNEFRAVLSNVNKISKQLGVKLDQLEKDMEDTFRSEIHGLSPLVSDADCQVAVKQSVQERAAALLLDADDMDLIQKEQKRMTLGDIGHFEGLVYKTLPWKGMKRTLKEMEACLKKCIKGCQVNKANTLIFLSIPVTVLSQYLIIKSSHEITGLCMDVRRQNVVVRSLDREAPIKVYTYSGRLLAEMAGGVDGIVTKWRMRGICMDTDRDLYMVPCEASLKLLDTQGVVQTSIQIGNQPYAVGYCQESDLYVMSDVDTHSVYVLNAFNHQVVTQFGSRGNEDLQFDLPANVISGIVAGLDETVIVVSDHDNHCIKLFDMSGKHLKTFGGHGQGDRQVDRSRGVAIDPAGRILVCDDNNQRVVSYWMDGGQDQWRCLLEREQLGGLPGRVAVDPVNRKMAVSVNDDRVMIYTV